MAPEKFTGPVDGITRTGLHRLPLTPAVQIIGQRLGAGIAGLPLAGHRSQHDPVQIILQSAKQPPQTGASSGGHSGRRAPLTPCRQTHQRETGTVRESRLRRLPLLAGAGRTHHLRSRRLDPSQ